MPNLFTNVLLIDSNVRDYQVFVNSVNPNTFHILFNVNTSITELLAVFNTHFTTISRVGIVFEMSQNSKLFIENETPCENTAFLISLINQFQIKNIDFLACNTLNMPDWKAFYDVLGQSTNVIVGASNNDTGNIQYGGDWIMESSMQDIELIYFTQSIEYYKYLLGASYANTSYALDKNGALWGAGENNARQLTTAQDWFVNANSYIQLINNTGLKPVYYANANDTLAMIMDNGSIYGCGNGAQQQLGPNASGYTSILTLVPNNTGLTPVSLAITRSLLIVLMDNGSVYVIGDNSTGGWGNGTINPTTQDYIYGSPNNYVRILKQMPLPNGTTAKRIDNDYNGSYVLCSDNKLYVTGSLSNNTQRSLTEIPNNTGLIPSTFSAGGGEAQFTIVLMTNGTIWGKGNNGSGQLGINNTSTQASFVQMLTTNATNSNIPVGATPLQIATGVAHTLVLMNNGVVYATGNNWGEIGINNSGIGQVSVLTAMVNTTGNIPVAINATHRFSQVLFSNGSVYTCGDNGAGSLGVGVSGGKKYVLTASTLTSNIVQLPNNPYVLISTYSFPVSVTQRIPTPIGPLYITSGITISHWLKCTTSASKKQVWMLVGDNNTLVNTNSLLRLNWFNQNWTTESQDGSGNIVTYSPSTFSNTGFTHVLVTIICNPVLEVKIYINGTLNSVATYYNNGAYSSPLNNAAPYYLHFDAYQNTNLATYNIGYVNIYQSVLNATQISNIYAKAAANNGVVGGTMALTYPTSPSLGKVTYVSGNTSVATLSKNVLTIVAPGTSAITATQESDGIYASSSITTTLTVSLPAPTLGTFAAIAGTFGSGTIAIVNPLSNSAGAFSYTSSNTGVATISGSTITMTGVGTTTITATQASTTIYSSASTTNTLTVSRISPTISGFTIPTKTIGNADFNLTAPTSTNSPGAFSYTSGNISIATIAGNTVSIVTSGTVAITAVQEASGNYLTGSITANLVINNPSPTIDTFTVASRVFGSGSFQLNPPNSSSNGVFTYTSSAAGVATISGSTVTIVGVGSTTITANQAAGSNHVSGSTTGTFTVTATAPTINSWSLDSSSVNNVINLQSFLPTSNSSGAFTFTSGNASVASISGNTLTTNALGSTVITAAQAAAGNYTSGSITTVFNVVYI